MVLLSKLRKAKFHFIVEMCIGEQNMKNNRKNAGK